MNQPIHAWPDSLLRAALLLALVGPALTFVVLPPALPLIAAHFGGGDAGLRLAQLALVLPFLGLALGGLCAGTLLQWFGSRTALLLAASVYLSGGALGLMGDQAGLLLGSCFVIGFSGAVAASGLVAVTDWTMEERPRSKMLGYQTAAADICTVFFGMLGAFLATTWGWQGPFAIYVGFGCVAVILIFAGVPQVQRQQVLGGSQLGVLRSLLKLSPVYLGGALVFMLMVTQTTQLPFFLAQRGIDTPEHRGIVMTSSTLAATLGGLVFSAFINRWGARVLHGIATTSALLGFAGIAAWNGDFRHVAAAVALVGLGVGLSAPALFSAALRLAPKSLRAHSVGLLNTSIFMGSFFSPVIFSPVASLSGYRSVFLLAACVTALAGGVRLLAFPEAVVSE